jgi:hypothetical protein
VPLPLDKDGEAKRAAAVEQQFGRVAPGVVQYTTDVLKAEKVFLLLKSYRLLCPEAHSMLRPLSESEIILARNCHTHNQPLY